MNDLSGALRVHARSVSEVQLGRIQGRLGRLEPDERVAVGELAHAVAEGVAESLLEAAVSHPSWAAVLHSVYAPRA